jgi:hypothetical protein
VILYYENKENEMKRISFGEFLAVFLIIVIGWIAVTTVGKNSWSLSGALGIPDWVVLVIIGIIMVGGLATRKK